LAPTKLAAANKPLPGKKEYPMKKFITIVSVVLLTACQTNDIHAPDPDKYTNYLDLSVEPKKALLDNYWLVESRVTPKYPIDAARNGLAGCTELIAAINSDGSVSAYKVTKSYPEGVFDLKSAESLNGWRYIPTATNKNSQPVLMTIQLDYMIEGVKNETEASKMCGFDHKIF
jgi:protein TonB